MGLELEKGPKKEKEKGEDAVLAEDLLRREEEERRQRLGSMHPSSSNIIDTMGRAAETVQTHVRENISIAEGFEHLAKETERAIFPKDPSRAECRKMLEQKQEEERAAIILANQQAQTDRNAKPQTGYKERPSKQSGADEQV